VAWAEVYLRSPYQVADILIHPAVWAQHTWAENKGCAPLGELGFHLTQCRLGRGLPPHQVASGSVQPFCHNTRAEKWVAALSLFWWRAGSPSNTLSPGPRLTSAGNDTLMHLAVWPQQTWAENGGGSCADFCGVELGPHLTQCGQGRCLSPCQVSFLGDRL